MSFSLEKINAAELQKNGFKPLEERLHGLETSQNSTNMLEYVDETLRRTIKSFVSGYAAPFAFTSAAREVRSLIHFYHFPFCDCVSCYCATIGALTGAVLSFGITYTVLSASPSLFIIPFATNLITGVYTHQKALPQKNISRDKKELDTTMSPLYISSGHCPVCSEEPKNPLQCKYCQTSHCTDCWTYNGGCGIFACKKTEAEPLSKATPLPDYIPRESQRIIESMYTPLEREILARSLHELKEKK